MSKDSVPKADGIKQLRDGEGSRDLESGDWPKRWKGYHRALKRREAWAVKLSKMNAINRLLYWVYRLDAIDLIYKENPFLELVNKACNWPTTSSLFMDWTKHSIRKRSKYRGNKK